MDSERQQARNFNRIPTRGARMEAAGHDAIGDGETEAEAFEESQASTASVPARAS